MVSTSFKFINSVNKDRKNIATKNELKSKSVSNTEHFNAKLVLITTKEKRINLLDSEIYFFNFVAS
ncbi:hypothetical protein D0T56_13955 [Dysgonomonas sp. 520]|nr:hypothetical protein [Dysgonomonas sp. 520]